MHCYIADFRGMFTTCQQLYFQRQRCFKILKKIISKISNLVRPFIGNSCLIFTFLKGNTKMEGNLGVGKYIPEKGGVILRKITSVLNFPALLA